MAFVEGLQSESDYLVWSQILSSLGTVKSVFSDNQEINEGLQKFTLKLITPAVEKIGIEQKPGDDFLTTQLRSLLVLTAGLNGHEKYTSIAVSRISLLLLLTLTGLSPKRNDALSSTQAAKINQLSAPTFGLPSLVSPCVWAMLLSIRP